MPDFLRRLQPLNNLPADWYDKHMNVIVYESRGNWARALRRNLTAGLPPLRETRSLVECDAELAAAPQSFVVAELNALSIPSLFDRFARWRKHQPDCAIAMVADPALETPTVKAMALEAGAALTVFSQMKLGGLVDAIRRYAGRFPQPASSHADAVWSELPFEEGKKRESALTGSNPH